MNVQNIPSILELAKTAREKGLKFVPLFAGDAGIGKSEICQQWAKAQGKDFQFLDIRLAYYEAPDMVGLPHIIDGRTFFATPELWPTSGKGLLLLEEPNRANTSVLNCIMQLLTDRKIGKYTLPDGIIIAAVINPDNAGYDVNRMDTALKDRFVTYDVRYDKNTFVNFMKANDWDNHIISFVESSNWVYKRPEELGDNGSYVAPRTFSHLNAARKCGVGDNLELHHDTAVSVLGKLVGLEFHKYVTETTPVLYEDWVADKKAANAKLKKYCADDYRGDMLNATVTSFSEKASVEEINEIAKILPPDLVYVLVYNKMKSGNLDKETIRKSKVLYESIKKAKKEQSVKETA